MKLKLLLISLTFLVYSNSFSQYFVGYENNLGALFEELPYGSRVVDTVIEYQPNYQQSWARLDSVNQYSSVDSIKQGENNTNSQYYSEMIPLRVHCRAGTGSTSQLILDTNGILFDTLNFNQFMNSYTETIFFISNHSTISSRIINRTAGRYYDVHFNLEYDSLVKLMVTSDLPSMDTVFVDSSGNRYTQIPQGFGAVDTSTIKIDSVIQTVLCTASNSTSDIPYWFRNVKPYNKYYLAFTVFNLGINSGKFSLDLDTVNLYNNVYAGQSGPPFRQVHYLNDTVSMDSNLTLILTVHGGKNSAVGFTNELFKTETRIKIEQLTNIIENFQDNQLRIYPNPVQSVLKLEIDNALNQEYMIFNLAGKLVRSGTMLSNELNVESISSGIYFLSIPELRLNKKFVKQD